MPFPGGGGGAVSSVNFPLSGTGVAGSPLATGPGLNSRLQFVSPAGNDSHDGKTWQTAKLTVSAAYDALYPLGGEIHYAESSQGPLFIRGDGWNLSGWKQAMPLRFVGHGKSWSGFFGYAPCARLAGGSATNRSTPLIWIAGTSGVPIRIENVLPDNGGTSILAVPYRAGWDYHRNPSTGAIAWANITSWVRTTTGDPTIPVTVDDDPPGTAVVTAAMQPAVTITSASRDADDIVTLNFAGPAHGFNPMPAFVTVTSSDPHFPSGTYTVIDRGNTALTYHDINAYHGSGGAIGTWVSHGINAGDRIEVASVTAEVPSTSYKVISVTATTLTVEDYYGYSPRTPSGTFSNPGQYVLEDRSRYGIGQVDFINPQGMIGQIEGTDRLYHGPTFDFGASADGRVRLIDSALTGDISGKIGDPFRYSWFSADSGASYGGQSPIVRIYDARPNGTGAAMWGCANSWGMIVRDLQGDQVVGASFDYPTIQIGNGNRTGTLDCERVTTADANPNAPAFLTSGMDPGNIRLISCGAKESAGNIDGTLPSSSWGSAIVNSPYKMNQVCWWADQRVAGKHPTSFRTAQGLNTARYKNQINFDTSSISWELNGVVATGGQPDYFGGTSAVKLTYSGQQFVKLVPDVEPTVVTGLRWVFGCVVRRSGGLVSGSNGSVLTFRYPTANPTFQALTACPFKGDGEWQMIVASATVTAVDDPSAHAYGYIYLTDEITICEPFIAAIPSGDMTDNEFAEYCATLRPSSYYLQSGMSGTKVDQKFIAHGGLGVKSSLVTVVTPGTADRVLTIFDQDGNALIKVHGEAP